MLRARPNASRLAHVVRQSANSFCEICSAVTMRSPACSYRRGSVVLMCSVSKPPAPSGALCRPSRCSSYDKTISTVAFGRHRRAICRRESISGAATALSRLPQGKMMVMRSATAASATASTSSGSAMQTRFEIPPRAVFRPALQAMSVRAEGLASVAMNRREGSRDAQWYGPRPSPLPRSM